MHPEIKKITERIEKRSALSREKYVKQMAAAVDHSSKRVHLSCGNLAHAFAACNATEKTELSGDKLPNLAIVSAYNDMLSAHKPMKTILNSSEK